MVELVPESACSLVATNTSSSDKQISHEIGLAESYDSVSTSTATLGFFGTPTTTGRQRAGVIERRNRHGVYRSASLLVVAHSAL
jgi:hypothetical protein